MPIDAAAQQPQSVQTALGAAHTQVRRPDQELGKDAFLKLLVAQLRYQDPSEPTKGAEFLAQTASFTQVEKLEEISRATASMLAAQNVLGTAGLVGRSVSYTTSEGASETGTVSGVRFSGGTPVLLVGTGTDAREIPVASVTEVRDTPAG